MRKWFRMLLDHLRPSNRGPATDSKWRTAYFRFAVVLLMVLAIGPELVVLMDLAALTSLYEILGGALFVAAYTSGAKLLIGEFLQSVRNMLLRLAPMLLLRSKLPRLEKVRVFLYLSATTAWSLAFMVGF